VSVTRLPSGRWRAQVYDPATGKNLSVSKVVGGPGTFATKTEAKQIARPHRKGQSTLGNAMEARTERFRDSVPRQNQLNQPSHFHR
jgi:hypothetical protein